MSDPIDQAQSIFLNALEIAPENERAAYVEAECGHDAELRCEVAELLDHAPRLGRFLDGELDVVATVNMPALSEPIGTQIGPYKLREQIGEGGMGVVYVAEQTEPVRRKVALKLIKPGMDTKQVIGRFDAERQTLALMDHPHVAKIHDAGTTESGRPYFVMELVRGIPITEYCDKARLSTRERLELLVMVCRAVQHAHQKGIIHRDLKPTNVLVTVIDGKPIPKVIDFGVAKAIGGKLTEQTVYTQFAQLIGTPLYMSPEQAEMSGVDVDTRSDVYSLGVLLYELLTGSTPFDKETMKQAGFEEMRRIIREDEPPRPSARISTLKLEQLSTLSDQRGTDPRKYAHALSGELDWIVMRALEKDRTRRYESASAFAADIERYLSDEPVEACPPSTGYRLRKYTRRNKAALITTALVVGSLLVGTGLSIWQAQQAIKSEQRAVKSEQRAIKSEQLAKDRLAQSRRSFEQSLEAVDQMLARVGSHLLWDLPQMRGERVEVIQDAVKFYRSLLEQEPENATVRFRMAVAQTALGDALHLTGGRTESENTFREAIATLDDLVEQFPVEPEYQFRLARACNRLGWRIGGKEKENSHRKAAALYGKLSAEYPENDQYQQHWAHSYQAIAGALQLQGQLSRAEALAHRAVNLFSDSKGGYTTFHATAYYRLAQIQQAQERHKKADEAYVDAIRIHRTCLQDVPPHSYGQHFLARSLYSRGKLLQQLDRNEQAVQCYREATEIWQLLVESYSSTHSYDQQFSNAQRSLVDLLIATDQTEEVEQIIRDMNPRTAEEYLRRAKLYEQLKEYENALADYDKAIELDSSSESTSPTLRSQLNSRYAIVGELLNGMGRTGEAERAFRRGLEIADGLTTEFPEKDYYWFQFIDSTGRLIKLLKSTGRLEEGRRILVEMIVPESSSPDVYVRRAGVFASIGQFDKALADYTKALELKPDVSRICYRHALVTFGTDDHSAYRNDCAAMLKQFAKSEIGDEMESTAWTCALAADALEDYEAAVTLARRAVKSNHGNAKYLQSLGAILYRAGRFNDALEHLNSIAESETLKHTSPAYGWYFLAMTHHKLGHEAEAKQWFDKAAEWTERVLDENREDYEPVLWNRRLTLKLFHKEAAQLLEIPVEAPEPETGSSRIMNGE